VFFEPRLIKLGAEEVDLALGLQGEVHWHPRFEEGALRRVVQKGGDIGRLVCEVERDLLAQSISVFQVMFRSLTHKCHSKNGQRHSCLESQSG
jgi:hypothetical protein